MMPHAGSWPWRPISPSTMKSTRMRRPQYWSSLTRWVRKEEEPLLRDGTSSWPTQLSQSPKRLSKNYAMPLKKPSSQRTSRTMPAKLSIPLIWTNLTVTSMNTYATTFKLAQARSGVDLDSILVDTLQWGVTNQLAVMMTATVLPEGQEKNDWKLLHGLRNQISSSTHSGVVRGHIEFLLVSLGWWCDDERLVRPKSSDKSKEVFLEGDLVMRSLWGLCHTGSPREETRLLRR